MIYQGDCRVVLPFLADNSIDAIVTDPPYHLTTGKKGGSGPASVNLDSPYGRARIGTGFMGMKWDGGDVAFRPETWAAVLRVLKPGGHMLAFSGTRTYHRMVCAIEDGGFEIRDQLGWMYGSGFPKSHNGPWGGTALKPAWEPIVLARKPLIGTVAENVLAHGTGGLNIDGCRIEAVRPAASYSQPVMNGGAYNSEREKRRVAEVPENLGRWPANLIHDGSDEVLAAFPQAKGQQAPTGSRTQGGVYGDVNAGTPGQPPRGDTGSAARFFYCAKASKADRGEGNSHPTVKPTELMRYLCRLITPPGGTVLDPFAGSGSTLKAALLEGFQAIGIEQSAEYVALAQQRIAA